MRRASNAIAVLLGKNNGPHLRTNDRALLFATRESARAWLSGDLSDPEHLLAGQRLFQDITTMAGMLLEVNKREELVRHDALLVRAALAELPPARAWGPVAAVELIARLRPILGRSPEVDALCDASPQALERAVVHQVLAELDAALAVQLHEELGPIAGGRSFEQ
ncbi:MAG: hypothetical protein R3F14_18685 [Polyangiaceae bacterium]